MSSRSSDSDVTSASASSEAGSWQDVDDGNDNEAVSIISLIDDKIFSDALSMLAYCKSQADLDFLAIRKQLGLDFLGSVKLVNLIRSRVKEGIIPRCIDAADLGDDGLLQPILTDDGLIMALDDLPDAAEQSVFNQSSAVADTSTTTGGNDAKIKALEAQLADLATRFDNYRTVVEATLDKRWEIAEEQPKAGPAGVIDESQSYWESYASHDIHETMIKDSVRTDAYRDFIYNNKHLFAGKTVLDIGCGTGILSMFCAKAGAAKVFAVDKSDIIDKARENVFHNGLGDVIICLRGRIEDVTLPVDKVDIIVSEWMGYCLLYEAMLPSVLWARDRYLKPDGLLVPSHATIWMAPVSDSDFAADHVTFWDDVYGFDMRAMRSNLYRDVRMITLPGTSVVGSACAIPFDLYKVTVPQLSFISKWTCTLAEPVDHLDGFILWFDNYFATTRPDSGLLISEPAKDWQDNRTDGSVAFTTSPRGKETHWQQGFLLLEKPLSVPLKAGAKLNGSLQYAAPEDYFRGLDISVRCTLAEGEDWSQKWRLQ